MIYGGRKAMATLTDGPLEEVINPDRLLPRDQTRIQWRIKRHTHKHTHSRSPSVWQQMHSRVVDNLEAVPFFEWQIIRRPRVIVVQRHEKRYTPWKHERKKRVLGN